MTCLGDLRVKPPPERILGDGSQCRDGSVEDNGARPGGGIAATDGDSEADSPDQAHAWPAGAPLAAEHTGTELGIGLILPAS